MRELRLRVGDGRLLLASDKLAVFASLLPNFTSHVGPPSYMHHKHTNVLDVNSTLTKN